MGQSTKLFQWSMICMLLAGVLDNFIPDPQSWGEISLWIQALVIFILLIVPVIGAVLGVMSWRKESRPGWAITMTVINIILVILGFFRLFYLYQ